MPQSAIKSLAALLLLTGAASAQAQGDKVVTSSPDNRLTVTCDVQNGAPTYSIAYDGTTVVEPSRLGLVANFADLTTGLTLDSLTQGMKWSAAYTMAKTKSSDINVEGSRSVMWYSNKSGNRLAVEFIVENNSVAFRYIVPRQGETGSIRVMSEGTEFRFPGETTTFLTPQSEAMIGWKRTKPSYEEEYEYDAPMDRKSKFGHGYTFPCLFNVGGKAWALVSETGVTSRYCASHLSDYKDGAYTIAYPMPEENNGNGTAEPAMSLPGETPWRTISVGRTPGVAAEQTITWDVVEPQYKIDWKPAFGKGTWSWILWQDASINISDQKKFIDLASEMGYQYALVDNWWDTNMGRQGIQDLVKYGKAKGVDLVIWYSSSGYWNDIVQGPINKMDRSITRKQEMRWLHSLGIKGIKVDFFGGDKQETMRLYEEILSDAADNELFVIFHGATLPRGWERMYPNYVGSEAVLASENLIFDQHYCDTEATCAALHPFVRNAVGCMEYGGSFLNRHMSRDNKSGNRRLTSQAFSLATAILFQNPMQFFALAPNNLTDAPKECIDFLKDVPTTWDETRIIDGYPGRYVVLARRNGDNWYVAAVNGTNKEIKIEAVLPFDSNSQVTRYEDGKSIDEVKVSTLKSAKAQKMTIAPNSGLVIVGK